MKFHLQVGKYFSGQVIHVKVRKRVSPIAKGAEFWAWKCRTLFFIKQWEHMFHKLT